MGKAGRMGDGTGPVAKAGMLIRRPVDGGVRGVRRSGGHRALLVFARQRPAGTGRAGAVGEMYGFATDVAVKAVEPNRRILVDWDLADPTEVEWTFEARGPDRTWVEVENRGFPGTPEQQAARALDSTGGFALVLAGAKIRLEHGIEPGFVLDRHPDARVEGWKDR